MKISIITATYNSEGFIMSNLNSVNSQTYKNYEHIIIDNESKDKTLDIIRNNGKGVKIISEKDEGIYDAFNKGIELATGDIISILNSDDYYSDNKILENIVDIFKKKNVGIVYGNINYVKRYGEKKILRYWKSNKYKTNDFKIGWSPPHPAFFVKKSLYDQYGKYKSIYGNSSDFELMYRFLEKNRLSNDYIDKTLVTMRLGGKSNKNLLEIIRQNLIILDILDIKKNIYLITKFFVNKFINRIKQLIILK